MRKIQPAIWILTVALLAWAAPNDKQAEVLLQAAMKLEMVDGNLDAAIQQYKKIMANHADSRLVAAKALVQMGQCYERLGSVEARKAYERVVREYADQREPAEQARVRLAALQEHRTPPPPSGIVSRQVWTGPQVESLEYGLGSISPDGRLLSFVDWQTGDLALRNLATGENRRLTNKGSWDQSTEFALFSRISPDGRLIAYNWLKKNFGWEIRVGPVDGSSYRALFPADGPFAWSPDGKQLAVLLAKDVHKIGLIPVAGGSPRVLKSFDWRTPGNMVFSPDGKYIAYDFPPAENSPERDIYLLAADGSREVRLVEHAADDYLLGWILDGRILFASDRSGTTDAWTLAVSEGKAQGAPELLKKDLGRVSSLGLTRAGSLYYGLRVGGTDVYTVPLDPQTGKVGGVPSRVAQRFIGTNIDPDWSPDGRRLAYVSERGLPAGRPGARILCIADLETGVQRELPLRLGYVSRPRWSPDGRSILFHANDEKGRLSLFVADAETGRATALVRRQGLKPSRWSPDGNTVFVLTTEYGDRVNRAPEVSWIVARDVKTGAEKELFRETTATPLGDFLVYDLTVSPDGRLLAFTVLRNKSRVVMIVSSEGGEPREIFRSGSDFHTHPNYAGLAWTPDGREILLVKASGIMGQTELWALPAQGGEPRPLGLSMKALGEPALNPDGRQIAFSAGVNASEVWALENLQRPVR